MITTKANESFSRKYILCGLQMPAWHDAQGLNPGKEVNMGKMQGSKAASLKRRKTSVAPSDKAVYSNSQDSFYKGFVILRSTSDQPYLTLSDQYLFFSKSAINMLECTRYVKVSVNYDDKSLIVQVCDNNIYATSFAKNIVPGKQINVRWSNRDILTLVSSITGRLKGSAPLRIWGAFCPEHKAIKFDLTDTQIMEG